MKLSVKDAVNSDELREKVEHFTDTAIHEAFHTLLIKQATTNRGVALKLYPLLGLFVKLAGKRQLSQIKVGA